MAFNTFIATAGHGLTRATLDNDRWSVQDTLTDQDVRCLAIDPSKYDTIYAGTQGNGVYRSTDRGLNWNPIGLAGSIVKAIAVSPIDPKTIYVGTKPAWLYVSRDSGSSWSELTSFRKIRSRCLWLSPAESPFTAYVQSIALSPIDPNSITVGIEAGAVVRSIDGGQTWSDHRRGALRDCHTLISHATNKDWMYECGGSGAGVSFSRDAGATWTQIRSGLDRHYGWAVAADPVRPEVWYASLSPSAFKAHSDGNAQAYIFRSAGGAAWQKLRGGLPQPLMHMPYAVLTDPTAPGHVYAGLSNGDVWQSIDHGDSWQQLPFNLQSINRALIAI
jgi:photosystem II stability/assembly factor-like uncharacterized protein